MKNYFLTMAMGLLVCTQAVQAEQSTNAAVTGQVSELIAQLREKDDAKRNAAVAALALKADDALPLLKQELKTAETSSYRWWLQVAINESAERATRPGQISVTVAEAKGLTVSEGNMKGDGIFAVSERGGMKCWEVSNAGHYLYLIAGDEFRQKGWEKLMVQVEYLDLGTGEIGMDYDSKNARAPLNGAYENHPKKIHLTNSGKWRTMNFYLPNAHFRGSENAGTDFRFRNGSERMVIRSVRVWPAGEG